MSENATTPTTALAPQSTATLPTGDLLWSSAGFEHAQRLAKMFAASELVPPHLRSKLADVTIALLMARRLDEDPLVVMQSIYVVSGRAGWSAQYVIARANRSGVFRGRINWRTEGKGDALVVTAFATLADSGDEVSFAASLAMAAAEGWTKNPKYKSMPELMLRYRSAVLLVRLYAPEVMLGYQTIEEIADVRAARGDVIDIPPVAPAEVAGSGVEVERVVAKHGTAAVLDALTRKPVSTRVPDPEVVEHQSQPAAAQSSAAVVSPTPAPAAGSSPGPTPVSVLKARCADLEADLPGGRDGEYVRVVRRELAIPDGDIGSWRGRPDAAERYQHALEALRDRLLAEQQRQPGEEG